MLSPLQTLKLIPLSILILNYMFISIRFSVTTPKTDILEQSRNFINARNIMSLPISNINKYSHNLQLNHVLFS